MSGTNKSIIICLIFLLASILSQKFSAQTRIQYPKNLDFCSSVKSGKTVFGGKVFMSYSTVTRVDGGDAYFYSPKCSGADYFALADFSNIIDQHKRWKIFFKNLPMERNFIFEVSLEENLKTSVIPEFGHLSWGRSKIEITKIKSIKDISNFGEKPKYKTKTPLTDLGNSLREINNQVVYAFINNGNNFDFDKIAKEEFFLVDVSGKNFNKGKLSKFFAENPFVEIEKVSNVSVSIDEANRINNQYKVSGRIVFTAERNNMKKFTYENFFEYKNGNWLLARSNFSIA